jgi:hypothetical protein
MSNSKTITPYPKNNSCYSSVTRSSECCPAKNGTQDIPFKGSRIKLIGLLSPMTILQKSFVRPEGSFVLYITCNCANHASQTMAQVLHKQAKTH